MSGLSKITVERNQKALLELVTKPGNDTCADCKARNPRWASHNLGIFICVNCASVHRKIGTHITKVKSITMDSWTKEQVEIMKSVGNAKSNSIFNPNEVRHPLPQNLMDGERDGELEQYIRSKYEFKRFLDKSAFVSSKLGPSKFASSMTSSGSSRPASTPLTTPSFQASAPKASAETIPKPFPHQRPSTVAAMAPTRSLSQPLKAPQYPSQQPVQQPQLQTSAPTKPQGIWADLVSLQTPSSSSLPLQYQPPSQTPVSAQHSFSGGIGSYQAPMSAGVSSFQQSHLSTNPFSQQMFATPEPQTSFPSATPYSAAPMFNSQQQPYFPQMQPPMSAPGTQVHNDFFQPQPLQGSLQVQIPSVGQALFAAGNPQSGLMSAPAMHGGHFMSPGPSQPFQSHSPQPFMSTTPQLPSHMLSTTPQPQPNMGQPSQPFMPTGGQMHMQMAQQQGPYSAQPQGQFSGFQAPTFPNTQWGAM